MRILKASLVYFGIVFGCGFALGTMRILWVVPRIGTRQAELLETPIMLVVSFVAARWTVVRLSVKASAYPRLLMGSLALILMLFMEFGFVLWIRGLSIREYLAARDPVSGTAYYLALALFAVMPLLAGNGAAREIRQFDAGLKSR